MLNGGVWQAQNVFIVYNTVTWGSPLYSMPEKHNRIAISITLVLNDSTPPQVNVM